MPSILPRVALAAIALAVAGPAVAQTAADPISKIDIIVRNKSGDIAVRTRSDDAGAFRLGALQPGDYSVALGGDSLRRALSGSGAERDPPIIGILVGLLLPAVQVKPVLAAQSTVRKAGGGDMEYAFTIPVPGDYDGDGRDDIGEYRGTVTLNFAKVQVDYDARANGGASAGAGPAGACATGKHFPDQKVVAGAGTGPARAPVVTSRSNKKAGARAESAGPTAVAVCEANSAMQDVSTTR